MTSKTISPVCLLLLILMAALLSTHQAHAANPLSGLVDGVLVDMKNMVSSVFLNIPSLILLVVDLMNYLVMALLVVVIRIAGNFVDIFLAVNNLAGSQTIQEFWRFTRDMLNFVYILVLLAIAFSTIAGIEEYGMRRLLPKLIFSALLVNFSLMIAGAFIQVSNVMCTTAIRGLGGDAKCGDMASIGGNDTPGSRLSTALVKSSFINQALSDEHSYQLAGMGIKVPGRPGGSVMGGIQLDAMNASAAMVQNNLMVVVGGFIRILFVAMFCVAIVALAILLGVRVGILVVLLVLAPIPFALGIIPQTQNYAKQWWSKFIQYTFFLPVVVFLLVLSIKMVDIGMGSADNPTGIFGELIFGNGQAPKNDPAMNFMFTMANTFFVSLFIIMSVVVGKAAGILGASAAIGLGKKVAKGTVSAGYLPARLAGQAAAKTSKATAVIAGRGLGRAAGYGAEQLGNKVAGGKYGDTLRAVRAGVGQARDIFGSKKIDEQISAQQKALAGKSEDDIKEACRRGNAGACAKLADSGDLEAKDFPAAVNLIPKNTAARDKMEAAWAKKDPISAVLGAKNRALLRSSASGTPEATAKKDKLQTAFKKMKPEDFAKLSGNDLEDAIKAGVEMPMTKSQLDAAVNSTNAGLQTAAEKHLQDLAKKTTLNPGQKAMLAYAKNKLNMNIPSIP